MSVGFGVRVKLRTSYPLTFSETICLAMKYLGFQVLLTLLWDGVPICQRALMCF